MCRTTKSDLRHTEEGLILVTTRYKEWFCGPSLAEIVGLNPVGGLEVCLWLVLCVVS
jgi:hypothetical protein